MGDFELVIIPFIIAAAFAAIATLTVRRRRSVLRDGEQSLSALDRVQLASLPVSALLFALLSTAIGIFFAVTG